MALHLPSWFTLESMATATASEEHLLIQELRYELWIPTLARNRHEEVIKKASARLIRHSSPALPPFGAITLDADNVGVGVELQ